jgi:hypothetical protein
MESILSDEILHASEGAAANGLPADQNKHLRLSLKALIGK